MKTTTHIRIGELADQSQVNLQTIRYYEREGLLPKPPRLASGYRVFSPDAVRRVRFIKRAQELGFSLKEIKELLSIRVDPRRDCSDVQRLAKAKLADIDQKIRTLRAMKEVLSRLATVCPGRGPSTECPILESFEPNGDMQ
ncbi:MAG: MerR family DNA-binding protein [Bryobacterales bacterium]|jgi:MerR family transcriptional regulator, copper efflux regulator|nr:MerR family DNA-binding protein [Bryobacterales bacterium]